MTTRIDLYSGGSIDLAMPLVGAVAAEDIAIALSRINRFLGHTRGRAPALLYFDTWSVAQHSLYVSELMGQIRPRDPLAEIYALLHDAHEAYVGDVVGPVKNRMQQMGFDFAALIEAPVQAAIHTSLGLAPWVPADIAQAVKECDRIALVNEQALFMGRADNPVRMFAPSVFLRQARPWDAASAFVDRIALLLDAVATYLVDATAAASAARDGGA